MTQLTLIGLGRIGTSIGLAIKRRAAGGLTVVGHDRDLAIARAAQAKGAVDKIEWNLPSACESADIILLCLPLSEMRKAMAEVAPHARPGCVISDTAALKTPVLEWAAELIPADRHFVGGVPILNPAYLHGGDDGARADLFDKGLWALVPHPEASPEAMKLIGDLAALLGATPFYMDTAELDSLLTATQVLPALTAAALIHTATASPGWGDARKLADRTFATATAPAALSSPAATAAAAVLGKGDAIHYLDDLIKRLSEMRAAIASGEADKIETLLKDAASARAAWLIKRQDANWEAEEAPNVHTPTAGDVLGQLIGFGLGRRREPKKK
jgi:prephenate dehydrogenase